MAISHLSDMFSPSKVYKLPHRGIWVGWIILCLAVCSIHLLTLNIDPLMNRDEVQIVDLGRTFIDQTTDWALTWYVQGDHPIVPTSYLGVVMQEIAFNMTSPSGLGPRYFAMMGAVLAATCTLGWLLVRSTPPVVSLILAFIFLVDPIFSGIYLGGRVDGWAIAACMGSCWLLRLAMSCGGTGRLMKTHVFMAGTLLTVSFFLWPSAAILMPLIFLECYYLACVLYRLQKNSNKKILFEAAFYFGAGSLIALMVLLIPFAWSFELSLSSWVASMENQKFHAVIQQSIADLFLVYDPFLFFTTLFAFAMRREVGTLIAFILALLLVYQTAIYLPRVLYFIPYFLIVIGHSYSEFQDGRFSRYAKKTLQVLLVLLVSWNVVQVLVINPIIAEAQRPANEPDQFLSALDETIGPGSYRVLLKVWPAYYAGRTLGWNMYLASNPVYGDEYTQFMSTMDFIILKEKPRDNATSGRLEAAGFDLKSMIYFARPKRSEIDWWFFKLVVPQEVYPAIKIYQKKQS